MSNDIVIIIDCWAGFIGPTDLRTKMCQNIISSINNINPALTVLATYGSNEIHDNYLKTHNPWVRSFWEYFPEFTDCRKNKNQETHNLILESNFDCKQIALTRFWQLEYLLNVIPNRIDRAWYFGLHWNRCIRDREIGWFNLKNHYNKNKNQKIEIIFKDNCTLKLLDNENCEDWPLFEYDEMTRCRELGNNTWILQDNS